MKKLITICAMVMLSISTAHAGYRNIGCLYDMDANTWTTIEPLGAGHSAVSAIEGSNLVGSYTTTDMHGRFYGFHYDMDTTTWTILDAPEATETGIYGMDGNSLVGYYKDSSGYVHGFLYDMDTNKWNTYDKPEATITSVWGMQNDYLVGYYKDGSVHHGFVYNMDANTWNTYDKPGEVQTFITGIEGSSLVGRYNDSNGYYHGFTYDMDNPKEDPNSWVTLDAPWAEVKHTWVEDIDGSKYVGSYSLYDDVPYNPTHGFLYDMNKDEWTKIDMPDTIRTGIYGIDGSKLVGCYMPEPGTLFLLGVGTVTLLRKRRIL